MNNKYLIAAITVCYALNASAKIAPPVITLGGDLDTQFGYVSQKDAFNVNANGNKLTSYGIVNDTQIRIAADATTPEFKYGGYLYLNADTSMSKYFENSVAYQTMLYVESSKYGRVEAGDHWGAMVPMMADANVLGVATGGIAIWGDWFFYLNYLVGKGHNIITPSLPTEVDGAYSLNATKLTYLTPKIGSNCSNIQAGISYTPDTDQHGTITNLKGLTKEFSSNSYYGGAPAGQLWGYTDVLEGGIAYSGKFNNTTIKISAVGEMGAAKKIFDSQGNIVKRSNLGAYEIAALLYYKSFGFAGSFGDWGKSGLYKNITNGAGTVNVANVKSGQFWDIGANYTYGAARASLGYLNTKNGGFGPTPLFATPTYSALRNKVHVFSISADYTLAPGFLPYAEITFANIHDRSQVGPSAKNTGYVFLTGTKLHF